MTINQDFILRQVAQEYLLIPVGQAALRIKGMIGLSESGYIIYQTLLQGGDEEAAAARIMEAYDVDEDTARKDIRDFLKKMSHWGVISEE